MFFILCFGLAILGFFGCLVGVILVLIQATALSKYVLLVLSLSGLATASSVIMFFIGLIMGFDEHNEKHDKKFIRSRIPPHKSFGFHPR